MKKEAAQKFVWRMNDGRIAIRPLRPKIRQDGTIILPEATKLGCGIQDSKGHTIEIDKSCIFGKVVACGPKANRGTCVTTDDIPQGDFPLPVGTLVVISGAVAAWKIDPNDEVYGFNTSEIHHWVLPGDPRPSWAPEE